MRGNRFIRRRATGVAVHRRAVATVEFVFCIPVLIAVTFATVDLCSAMFLKETLTIAAYEGSRVGIRSGGSNANAISRAEAVLTERGVTFNSDAVTISSPGFDSAATLDMITVTVQVPCADNLPVTGGVLFAGQSVSATVTLRKEFANP